MPKFRNFYSVRGEARKGLVCPDESRTRQEFLKESLTSTIMERFSKTGVLCPTSNPSRVPMFGDFSQLPGDLLEAHSRLENVRMDFESLPAPTRALFGNNPLDFVRFVSNPANRSKAEEIGLIPSPKKQAAKAAKPESPASAATPTAGQSDKDGAAVVEESAQ